MSIRFLLIQGIGFLGTILFFYLISSGVINHCFGFSFFPICVIRYICYC